MIQPKLINRCEKCGRENPLKHSTLCSDCEPKGLVHEFMMEIDD